MSNLITPHKHTNDIALFESDGIFWIGSYSDSLTHQNGEPPYVWIRGDFKSVDEGLAALDKLTGNEF